jgi:hypothetical protein
MGEKRNVYRLLLGKPEGRRPLGIRRRGYVDNIKVDLIEKEWGGVRWIGPSQNKDKWRALVNAVMNFRATYNVGKLSSGYTTGGLSSSSQRHRVSYNSRCLVSGSGSKQRTLWRVNMTDAKSTAKVGCVSSHMLVGEVSVVMAVKRTSMWARVEIIYYLPDHIEQETSFVMNTWKR